MNFELSQDQQLMRDSIARFLNEHSSMARVRAAAASGFDPALWKGLADLGAFSIRTSEAAGGTDLGTFDAVVLMEEVGRTLASGPIAETILAAGLLARIGGQQALLDRVVSGDAVVTLAFHDVAQEPVQFVTAGAVADAVIARNGEAVVLITLGGDRGEPNLGSMPMGEIDLALADQVTLASGPKARAAFDAAIEEWKLLTAAALVGLSRRAVEMAAEYAGQRKAFGQFIGTFQAISHPLAVIITDTDGAKLFVWKTLRDLADGAPTAAGQISVALWWACDTSARAVSQALQTFGGYGLTLDYDIYLYNLRAKAWPLVFDDPARFLAEGARRLYGGEVATLPEVGDVPIDLDRGEEARQIAEEVHAFFDANLTPELREKAHFSWEGYDPDIHKKLAEAGLLFPEWPAEIGGRGISPYAATSLSEAFREQNWTGTPGSVARMVGAMIHRFGSDDLKQDVLAKLAAGEAICSLGWSEPNAGSDVFAAQTRATRDGNGWRIDGQKMFTSGANVADYVYMIVRTDPDLPKHKGITMFVVPLDAPGVTIQPIYTYQDEPTNVTFYDGVRIPDSHRIGEVNGGLAVMSATLEIEHSASYAHNLAMLYAAGEQLCRDTRRCGHPLIEDPTVQVRLARIFTQLQCAIALNERMLWATVEKKVIPACGPMARLQSAEAFFEAGRDLLDLTAPVSLTKRGGPAAFINQCYRHGHASRIYGGSQEVQRSQIAERHLGMPRTRSGG